MNRHLRCRDCDNPKWVSQREWKSLLDKWKTPRKTRNRFQCRECKKIEKKNPFVYQIHYGEPIKNLRGDLKIIYRTYLKTHKDRTKLQQEIMNRVSELNVPSDKISYHIDGTHLQGITLREVTLYDYTSDVYVPMYTPKESNKKWELKKKNLDDE